MADRALHIGIDARELAGHPTGVGKYLSGLLRAWAADAGLRHRFTLFAPHENTREASADSHPASGTGHQCLEVPELSLLGPRFTFAGEPTTRGGGTWWEQAKLPGLAAKAGVDVWFSPGYTAPQLLRCPLVVAIHDVSFFAHPEWFGWREGLRRRWLTRASAHRAHSVVTISEFSAGEIVRRLRIPRDRITLAPPGAPHVALPVHGARQPIVLFVGSLFNRRRLPDMLHAFKLTVARVPEARLILVGDNRTHPRIDPLGMAATLGLSGQVEWRSYVCDEERDDLYDRAKVFLFLSEYEGFAMTPLEALAHGVPSVLLDTKLTREVYGRAARISPGNAQSISDALVELLTDAGIHAQTMEAGRTLLATYSWASSAKIVLQALEEAAAAG